MNKREKQPSERQVVGFVGIGLDSKDGHSRVTRSEHFLLMGGSDETHGRMQDTAIRFEERLKSRGKQLQEASLEEVVEILFEAREE